MKDQSETNELSIVLYADETARAQVDRLRDLLPTAPHRVDVPHITLLNGVHSNEYIDDEQLISDVATSLKEFRAMASQDLAATVTEIKNFESNRHGQTSSVELNVSAQFTEERSALIGNMEDRGYGVADREKTIYHPHISIGYGVPLPDDVLLTQKVLAVGDRMEFSSMAVFRMSVVDGKRKARVIEL